MATKRYTDLLQQGFMKTPAKKRGPKKAKAPRHLYVLHHNWTGNWSSSAKFAFHATSVPEAKTLADRWARYHGFSLNDVAVEEITREALPNYKVEIHDEWLR